MRICFWNTNKNIEINKYIVDIVCENNVDIFVLAEYAADFEKLQLELKNCKYDTEKGITVGCDRITILKRKYNMEPGFQNKYCSLQIIENKYILTCLHLPSKRYAERLKKDIAIHRIIEEIQRYEKLLKTDKTIIVGDVNENPYETGCLGADRFHGVPVYQDAIKKYRTIMDERFEMFYNPMWNFFGDFSFPPGTYYYMGNEVNNSFWNIYDQVMIRPCIRDFFVDNELKILCKTGTRKLIDENNHPSKIISDHLPIIFEIKED